MGLAVREAFNMMGGAKPNVVASLAFIVVTILVQLLFIWLVRFLWNTYLTKCITVVKPIKDVWHMLAIFVIFKVLF
jgi:hypothetical protein